MLPTAPLVSVIIPVYNGEQYVGRAIQSVRNQSCLQWELIIIDDGSTDRTRGVITPFLEDGRIHYIHQENSGQGSARNTGIRRARGTYLAFLDADDLWDEHKLKAQIAVMQKENPCLVFSRLRRIDKNGAILAENPGSGASCYEGFTAFFLLAAGTISIPNSSVLVKKTDVESVGGFKVNDLGQNIEDYDLWFRLLLAKQRILGSGKVLGSYRRHENQITSEDSGQNLKMIDYLEKMNRKYPDKKEFFQFLILQRLSMYYRQHNHKAKAKVICLKKFYFSSCLDTYWFEKYLIKFMKLNNYFRFRQLLIRRFRRFQTFVAMIDT